MLRFPVSWTTSAVALSVVAAIPMVACGTNDDSSGTGDKSGTGGSLSGGSDGPLNFSDPTVAPGPFRYGINMGHRNKDWGDPLHAELSFDAGCNSMRNSLPERHLDRWGYDIELADMAAYDDIGMGSRVAFLTSPIAEHSSAPADAADWELDYYPPANLYEPILLEDGSVNPDNYWGMYVYETVSRYKPWVKIWEIWNEPDWVSDWSVTETWVTEPPLADELPHWNGSVYEYVRLLRVSRVAARKADPDALIATGGIGYETFLAALLRYSDNPAGGSVTDEYPQTGGAYFDVLSFHHYPLYTEGNSDSAVDAYIAHHARLSEVLAAAGKDVLGWENTETGAPHRPIPETASGDEYARNYLIKVMTLAQAAGVNGVHWYLLSDYGESEPAARADGYEWMGLYEDIAGLATTDQARHTSSGIAYATLGGLLRGAGYDEEATNALHLADPVRGAAFSFDDGRAAYVLWARAEDGGEDGSGNVELPTTTTLTAYQWNGSATGESTTLIPNQGSVSLDLSGSPTILVETPAEP